MHQQTKFEKSIDNIFCKKYCILYKNIQYKKNYANVQRHQGYLRPSLSKHNTTIPNHSFTNPIGPNLAV